MGQIPSKNYVPFDWNAVDRAWWLIPCEESWYYAEKWKHEGRRSILDLGCGLGRHSVLFAKYGFKVTAADISDDALNFLKQYAGEQGVPVACRKADMESLPFADCAFDCVFSMYAAGHTDSPGMGRIMEEIKRVLKPGGTVFMTLCSKDTWAYCGAGFPQIDANTVIKTEGPEQGVPHFYADAEDIKRIFADFELVKVRHIDDCFSRGKWQDERHYFIEAILHKQAAEPDYTGIIGKTVRCRIDRPLGSAHPKFPDLVYPVNYGYAEGIPGGDGEEQDVYILGIAEPLEVFTGKVAAVYHRLNDNEDKWIIVPEGMRFTGAEILQAIDFQEQFFDGILYEK